MIIKLDKPASGIRGLRGKYWSGRKSGLDTGETGDLRITSYTHLHICVCFCLCMGQWGDQGIQRLATG